MNDVDASFKAKKRFQVIALAIGIVLFSSMFFGEKYSLIGFLPIYIGGACIAYMFNFEQVGKEMSVAFLILSAMFLIREWGQIQHSIDEDRMVRKIEKICYQNSEIQDTMGCDEILSAISSFTEPPIDEDY